MDPNECVHFRGAPISMSCRRYLLCFASATSTTRSYAKRLQLPIAMDGWHGFDYYRQYGHLMLTRSQSSPCLPSLFLFALESTPFQTKHLYIYFKYMKYILFMFSFSNRLESSQFHDKWQWSGVRELSHKMINSMRYAHIIFYFRYVSPYTIQPATLHSSAKTMHRN